jgi:hypothetical protein
VHQTVRTIYRISFTLASGILVAAWLYMGAYGFLDGEVDIGPCAFWGILAGAFAWFAAGGPFRRRANLIVLSLALALATRGADDVPLLCWIAIAICMAAWLARDIIGEPLLGAA